MELKEPRWVEEFDKMIYEGAGFYVGPVKDFIAKHLSRAVAKERTQVLLEVKEKVEKTRFPHTNRLWANIGYSQIMYIVKKLKEEQLKKLRGLEQEGK